MSQSAHRRAVARGNGWYGFALDVDGTAAQIEGLRKAEAEVERDPALGKLEISVTPTFTPDGDSIRQLEDLGVDRVIPILRGLDREGLLAFVEKLAADTIT